MDTAKSILVIILLALSAGAVFYLILVLMKTARVVEKAETTVDELNTTVAELRPRVLPIIENAEETVSRLNNDLEQVEFILSDVASITENLASVSNKVTGVVEAPVKVTNGIVERFLQLRKERMAKKKEVSTEPDLTVEVALKVEPSSSE